MIMQYVFMTEELSMEAFLKIALAKLLPDGTLFKIIPHEGKQDLERSIPKKIRAWRNNNEIQYRFVIIRDKDSGDCLTIKRDLEQLCFDANRVDSVVIIAIHELESWFLGDLGAVAKAYNDNSIALKQVKRLYRNPDKIANASEQLYKICKESAKISRSRKITKEMDFSNNASYSFRYFIQKVAELQGDL